MTRPQLNPEISWGSILNTIALVATVASLYFGINAKIIAEAYARELGDTTLQQQAAENTAAIERNIEAIKGNEAWSTAHKQDWAKHLGAYEADGR